jgi:hypothetical protein
VQGEDYGWNTLPLQGDQGLFLFSALYKMNKLVVTLVVTAAVANLLPSLIQETGTDIIDDAVLYTGVQKEMLVSALIISALVYWITDYILENWGNSSQ